MWLKIRHGDISMLSEQREKFCLEYILNNENASEAARRSGYSETGNSAGQNGYRLLKNVEIVERIRELREESGIKSGVSLEWAIANLVGVVERSMTREPVVDSDGNVYEYKYDSRGVVSALKLIGEMKGWLEKKQPPLPESKSDQSSAKIQYEALAQMTSLDHPGRIKFMREMKDDKGNVAFSEDEIQALDTANQ